MNLITSIKGNVRRQFILFVAFFLLLFATTSIVLAAATWSNIIGPTWNGLAWDLTGTVDLSPPHHQACMHVTVPDGPNAGTFNVVCSTGVTSGTQTFTCSIAGSLVEGASSPISWYLFAASNSNCGGGNTTLGTPNVTGSFNSNGPTAIALNGAEAGGRVSGHLSGFLLAGIFILAAASFFWMKRRRNVWQR